MFTVEALIALLQKQKPQAELQSLQAAATASGLEVSGRTAEGKNFRIVSMPRRPPTT